MAKKVLYFLCTGNSCRSQIAEGFGKKYLGATYEIYSAGLESHGVHPNAVAIMKESGVDISRQTSDTIDTGILNQADVIITLCGDANEKCPITPTNIKRLHWEFDDPAKVEGNEKEIMKVFRRVRNEIEERIKHFAVNGE